MNKHSCKFITQWLILFGTVGIFALYIWFRYEQARQKQMSKDSSWFSYLPSLLKSGNVNDQTSSSWLSLVPSMLKSGSVEEGTRPNILLYIVECLWEDLLHLIDLVCKLAYKVAEFTIVIVSVCCVVGIIIVYQRNTKTSGRQNKDTSGKQTETSSSKQNISERRNKNIKQEHQTDHTENGNSASKMASSSYSVLLKWYSYMTTKKIENAKQPEKPKKKFKITFSALLKWFIFLTFVMFLASIPWEYIRLYQLEVAKRVSVMQLGIPKECVPHEMSIFQSMKHWITWHMSWQLDPCEKYHKAMLVDPMWEIPPLLVLWSALTRCLLHPVELFFGALGKSFRLFFSEIPAQWQPVMMILMILLFIFTLILSCGYRLSVPFFMKIEPKTPVVYRCEEKIQKTEKDLNEKKKLELKND